MTLEEENKILREALQQIINPLPRMREEAKKQGAVLTPWAYDISNDPEYLRVIAKDALRTTKHDINREDALYN